MVSHAMVVAAAFVWLAVPVLARGQAPEETQETPSANAAAVFQRGVELSDEQRHREAAAAFEAAYVALPHPEFLYRQSLAEEAAGDLDAAVVSLRLFLTVHPDADDTPEAEARLEALEEQRAWRPPPVGDDVSWPPRSGDSDGNGESGDSALSAVAVGGLGSLAGAAVLGVGALVTGLMSHSTFQRLQDDCPASRCGPELHDEIDEGQTLETVSTVLTVGAGGALGVGLILLMVDAIQNGRSDDSPLVFGPQGVGGSF